MSSRRVGTLALLPTLLFPELRYARVYAAAVSDCGQLAAAASIHITSQW
jgi:hypothetical protein